MPNANGKRAEPLREIVVMLLGQQCGRHQHGDLTIVLDRFEGRPHGDLGLAVPDIAAHQAIHRLRGLQIALNVLDGFDLIGVSSYSNAASKAWVKVVSSPYSLR